MAFMWRIRVRNVASSQQYNILEESRVLFCSGIIISPRHCMLNFLAFLTMFSLRS